MTDRERALLYGVIAGLICYAMTVYGAGWPKADAGLTAAFWTAMTYYITLKTQE